LIEPNSPPESAESEELEQPVRSSATADSDASNDFFINHPFDYLLKPLADKRTSVGIRLASAFSIIGSKSTPKGGKKITNL
jgi:hypothetical protein